MWETAGWTVLYVYLGIALLYNLSAGCKWCSTLSKKLSWLNAPMWVYDWLLLQLSKAIVGVGGWCIVRLPVFCQWPFYKVWKRWTRSATASINPLVGFPALTFIELNMDRYFRRGGIRLAKHALFGYLEKSNKKLIDGLEAIANARIRQIESQKNG